jgi:hypothetical protein
MKRATELQDDDEVQVGVNEDPHFARVIGALYVTDNGHKELWVTMAVPMTAVFEVGP